jgi:hypothetical protein
MKTCCRHKIRPDVENEPDHHKIRSVSENELDHHKIRSVIQNKFDHHKIRSVIENQHIYTNRTTLKIYRVNFSMTSLNL